jgi:hypothetical protein
MPLRGRVRRLEKQAARLEAQRLQAHRFAIRSMTLEQRALGILDLFARATRRAGRPLPDCWPRLRAVLGTPGPEAAVEASRVLAWARELCSADIAKEAAR